MVQYRDEYQVALDYVSSLNIRILGGDCLFIKPNGDCLTIGRCCQGNAQDKSIEGEWTQTEIEAAIDYYEQTEAAQR